MTKLCPFLTTPEEYKQSVTDRKWSWIEFQAALAREKMICQPHCPYHEPVAKITAIKGLGYVTLLFVVIILLGIIL